MEHSGTCPMDCPDACSWIVTVKDGVAKRLRGDPNHPYTRGALCAKMNDYLKHVYHPDRLMHPMRRVGAKGEGKFERISWDEAIDLMAENWRIVIGDWGAEAIWPYIGDGSFGWLQGAFGAGKRLTNVLGTSVHKNTICTIAGGVGTEYTLGHHQIGMNPEAMRFAKLVILWGTNTLSTNHHLWHNVDLARADGAKVVVIDPIKSRTAAQADYHLAPIPGTDAALALGFMNIILCENAEDSEFIEQHTLGWYQFKDRIEEFTPQNVSQITGLEVSAILEIGKMIAHTRPTAIKMGMGLQRHGGGGMAVRTITCIPGVTGDWRFPGGGAVYDTRGFFKADFDKLHRADLRPAGVRTLNMTELGDGLNNVSGPPVKSLCIVGANPVASAPGQNEIIKGLLREDLFTVAIEQFETDTTRYADLILPTTCQLEHHDVHFAYGHLYVSWNRPSIEAPGECLPATEIFRRLGRALNVEEDCVYAFDEELVKEALDIDDPAYAGITPDSLKESGWSRLSYPSTEEFAPFAEGFPTPSGKLEFYSERMLEDGLDPLAGYTPPYETALDSSKDELAMRHPYCLLAGAKHYQLNSIFGNSARHQKRQGEPVVLVHPDDAARHNLVDGMVIKVFNDRGEFHAQVSVSDEVRRGVISTTKGSWPGDRSGNRWVNATVAERASDMGNGTVFNDNRVSIECAPEL